VHVSKEGQTAAADSAVEVSNRFSALAECVQDDWDTYRDEMNSAAMAVRGTVQSKSTKKDWLTCEPLDLTVVIVHKRAARLAGNTVEHKRLITSCKDRVHQDKQQWADAIATSAEQTAGSRSDQGCLLQFPAVAIRGTSDF